MNSISTRIDGREYEFKDVKDAEQKRDELKGRLEQLEKERKHVKKAIKWFNAFLCTRNEKHLGEKSTEKQETEKITQ